MSRTRETPEAMDNTAVPFVTALALYPILEALVSHLRPNDLVNLTTTCQVVNNQIRMREKQVKASLLTKTLCPGTGLQARLKRHCPCRTRGWHSYCGCGGEGYNVTSKPCISCGINTCDECRIHVSYQVYVEDPGLDGHRWWAGYVLNYLFPFAIYPPKGDDGAAWHLQPDMMQSHHDQGRLHLPLYMNGIADAEPISRILDTDLGKNDITPSGRTSRPFEGVYTAVLFKSLLANRKELVCRICFDGMYGAGLSLCSCTLRKRFLDRWTCVPCHLDESKKFDQEHRATRIYSKDGPWIDKIFCRCGDQIVPVGHYEVICRWCNGHVVHVEDDNADANPENVDKQEFTNNEDDEENAGSAPVNLPPDHMAFVNNKDETLSIYVNGSRISGERIGRSIVRDHLSRKGIELPCACCDCSSVACENHHHHQHSDDESEDVNVEASVDGEDVSDHGDDGHNNLEGLDFDDDRIGFDAEMEEDEE
ncbi:hypothetical protein BDU57DRAFT_155502 [Ampelomyces quisqualis]|uniref:Uncharacterized protein n=1 Tax=Ampelomyces quisqualis TaxID=50730 RepID=A0A6A5QVT6_AMPQU|nr:hypothetical protein BDU57DRAFT_155502 [Ampelomyces quisqualis]